MVKIKKAKSTLESTISLPEVSQPKSQPSGRKKKTNAEESGFFEMSGPKFVSELKTGDVVIYSAKKCVVQNISKCLDKSKPQYTMISLIKHPIHGAITLPCLAKDIFYTEISQ